MFLHHLEKPDRLGSHDNPVIVREAEVQHRADDDLSLPDDRGLHDFAHPEDGALGLVNEGVARRAP